MNDTQTEILTKNKGTMSKLPEHYTIDDQLKRLAWEDLDGDLKTKKPVGIFGIPFLKFSFKKIRMVGLHFKIPCAHNSKKADTIAGLTLAYQNRETYAQLDLDEDGNKKKPNRQQTQCPYWLINILFSDEFAYDFASLGYVADRHELDSEVKHPTVNNSGSVFRLLFVTTPALALCILMMMQCLSAVILI